jgi:hypothetical protein
MLPATRRQAEVVKAIGQGLAGNGDLETVAYREIRQALPTGLMMLREEDLFSPPCSARQRAIRRSSVRRIASGTASSPNSSWSVSKTVTAMIPSIWSNSSTRGQNGSSGSARVRQWRSLLLGRKLRIVLDPACAALADTGLGSRDGLGVLATMGHEEKYLLIGMWWPGIANPSLVVR